MSRKRAEVKSKSLTKEDILAARDSMIEKVETPEWGGHVFVRGMTGEERDQYESMIHEGGIISTLNIHAKLASFTICDENGIRSFTESDIQGLTKKSAAPLHRIFNTAQRLSGMKVDLIDLMAILKNARPASSPTG
jgi:hypothetical protein